MAEYLIHHGIKGQKWGVRRFQNEDGSLTAEGRKRYSSMEGGSRGDSKSFNRQMKKFNRLAKRTDVDLQKRNAAKYDSRTKKSLKVAAAAGGTAAVMLGGKYGLGKLAEMFDNRIVEGNSSALRQKISANNEYADNVHAVRNLERKGDISEKYSRKLQDEYYDKYHDTRDSIEKNRYDNAVDNAKKRDTTEVVRDVVKGVGYAAAATAAISAGFAAYNKVQSNLAKKRMTDLGHDKAVREARAQLEKMKEQFANTPYAELLKGMDKNIKHSEG